MLYFETSSFVLNPSINHSENHQTHFLPVHLVYIETINAFRMVAFAWHRKDAKFLGATFQNLLGTF